MQIFSVSGTSAWLETEVFDSLLKQAVTGPILALFALHHDGVLSLGKHNVNVFYLCFPDNLTCIFSLLNHLLNLQLRSSIVPAVARPTNANCKMAWAEIEEEQLDYHSCDNMSVSGHDTNPVHEMRHSKEDEDPHRDEDSDIDADIPHAHGPSTTTERRRAQNEILRAFAANISAHATQKEVDEAVKGNKDEQLSIRDILAKQETTVRITNPRDYQTELFQRAKTENIVAVLDTGSGKTHIATLLLRHVLDEELEHRAKGGVHRIAFFLVRAMV